MSVIRLLAALLVVMLAGWGCVRLVNPRSRFLNGAEHLALSWVLGSSVISFGLWLAGLVLSGPGLILAVVMLAVILAGAGWSRKVGPMPAGDERWNLRLLIAFGFIFAAEAAFIGVWTPRIAIGWDGLAIWEYKARLAFMHGGVVPSDYFSDATLAHTQQTYPLHLSNLEAWIYLVLGRVDQPLIRVIGPVYYAAAALLLATGTVRGGGSWLTGLCAAAGLFCVPYILTGLWGGLTGYADFPLGTLYLAAMICLPRESPTCPRPDWLLGLLSGFLMWGKREGVVLWLCVMACAVIPTIRSRSWRILPSITIPGLVVWTSFNLYLRLQNVTKDVNYDSLSLAHLIERADRIPMIFRSYLAELGNWESWGLLWPGVALAMVALAVHGRFQRLLRCGISIVGPMVAFAPAYVLSTWPSYLWHMELSLPRLLLQLTPVAVLMIALAIPSSHSLASQDALNMKSRS